jgi:hypothetical protein
LTPPAALRVATSRFTTVADDDVRRSMKDWPTCRLRQWRPSNVVANGSSGAVVSPVEGVGIGLCTSSDPGTGWTYYRFDHLELFGSDPPGAKDPLRTSPFLIQNDSGLSQGLAHHSAAG